MIDPMQGVAAFRQGVGRDRGILCAGAGQSQIVNFILASACDDFAGPGVGTNAADFCGSWPN
jgi:hypothetical protein